MKSELETRLHLLSVAGFMATCKRQNTHEWMDDLASRINEVCEATNDDCRVTYSARSGAIEMYRVNGLVEKEPK